MQVSYSENDDAAYIRLIDEIEVGGVAWTYACDPHQVGGMINLDFDHHGHLVAIEVLDAKKLLAPETLNS